MPRYIFEFDLEKNKISKNTCPHYAIRYYDDENSILVEVGDGYRHYIKMEAEYWDRILEIIKNNELDRGGIRAIIRGLMRVGLREEYEENFLNAIKEGKIKSTKEFI